MSSTAVRPIMAYLTATKFTTTTPKTHPDTVLATAATAALDTLKGVCGRCAASPEPHR